MRDGPTNQETIDPRRAVRTGVLVLAGVATLTVMRPRLAGTIGVLLAVILMIMLHELGHYVMAKRAGMKVTEFFLGFGPRLWSIRRGETEYGVKAILLGGYVKIIGMTNLDEVDAADEERTYRAKPYRQRLGVAVAGSAMHFMIAALLLFVVYAAVGFPTHRPVIDHIAPGSPAAQSELNLGDRIVAINGTPIREWDDVPRHVQSHGTDQLVFTVERAGERLDIAMTPTVEEIGGRSVPRVGVGPRLEVRTEPIPTAVVSTAREMPSLSWMTIKALGGLFSPSGVENYGQLIRGDERGDEMNRLISPLGAARIAGAAVDSGWGAVLSFLIVINIFVGIFNMVPLLPLDGGHVAIATYEKAASMITRRRVQVDFAKLMPVTAAVLVLLVLVGVTALYLDIVNPVRLP